ncbi:uncharacterized protein LOC132240128 [Myotis daubentonii]|uniref:uncharacterized protein LOC132240128 n=1 Tax=Myotis daubentonii TaxID=98922 RepID=UPI00287314E4|nr:uncharacterized protein LOC132240128 [Myotis daubentonii]
MKPASSWHRRSVMTPSSSHSSGRTRLSLHPETRSVETSTPRPALAAQEAALASAARHEARPLHRRLAVCVLLPQLHSGYFLCGIQGNADLPPVWEPYSVQGARPPPGHRSLTRKTALTGDTSPIPGSTPTELSPPVWDVSEEQVVGEAHSTELQSPQGSGRLGQRRKKSRELGAPINGAQAPHHQLAATMPVFPVSQELQVGSQRPL